MLAYINKNRTLFGILGLWFIAGYLISPALYVLVPLTIFTLSSKNKYLILFLGFWFILILSDARGGFASAANVKIIYLLILAFFYFQNNKIKANNYHYKNFIPFIMLSLISLAFSPIIFTAAQKTLSYFLLIFIVPPFVSFLLQTYKRTFLLGLVYLGAGVLLLGLIMRFVSPSFATLAGRFSGLFGNPNGLGIFSILFTILWCIIKYYNPNLFTKRNKIFINLLILASVFMCASRGALVAVTMFYILDYSVRKNNPFIVFLVIVGLSSFFFIDDIVGWLYSIGAGEYLRAQTLETGSGRVVAYEYAWEQIKLNPIFGKGFAYSEFWFHQEEIEFELNMLNHQGNTHNSYLTILMDTGFIGLLFFIVAWGSFFVKAFVKSRYTLSVLIIVMFSSNIEAWLAASLNPFTIILIIILTLLTDKNFVLSKR